MLLKFIFIFLTTFLLFAILGLFVVKAGLQLQYLNLKKKKKKGQVYDILQFDWSNSQERQKRWEAFLLFPLLFAITLDDSKEELNQIKLKVKRIHIAIYIILMILVVLAIYSQKVFPV